MTPNRETRDEAPIHPGREPLEGDRADLAGLHALPREIGVLLLSAGVVGIVMPGPGTPALIAGGLVLWPEKFGKAEVGFRRRFPSAHREGMRHIRRFLDDLERRYPGPLGERRPGLGGPTEG